MARKNAQPLGLATAVMKPWPAKLKKSKSKEAVPSGFTAMAPCEHIIRSPT